MDRRRYAEILKKGKHTRDTISKEKEQWGVGEFPVWEDRLRFVVPISTAEIVSRSVEPIGATVGSYLVG
jgi:hypothetical protein